MTGSQQSKKQAILSHFLSGKLPEDVTKVGHMPITVLYGIGDKYLTILQDNGITSIRLLARTDPMSLAETTGISVKHLEKWITAARLIISTSEEKFSGDPKIIIAGLDNTGKTTIIKTLSQDIESINYPQSVFTNYVPTIGTVPNHYELFSILNVFLWDFGGQEGFRNAQEENSSLHFGNTDLMIYVIDVVDQPRFKETLDHLSRIRKIFEYLKQYPPIMVWLHKYDPHEVQNLSKTILKLESKVNNALHGWEENGDGFKIFKTSIYDTATLYRSFSTCTQDIVPASRILNGILEDYGDMISANALFIMDTKGMVVSSWSKTKELPLKVYRLAVKNLRNITDSVLTKELLQLPVKVNEEKLTLIMTNVSVLVETPLYAVALMTSAERAIIFTELMTEIEPWLYALIFHNKEIEYII